MTDASIARSWLLLLHQLPPQPAYFRVKIWRRLQSLGAVGVKNSVYALPANDDALEDFQWLAQEIVAGGGEATIVEARLVEGLSDQQVIALFDAARTADWDEIVAEARQLADGWRELAAEEARTRVERLAKRAEKIAAIDFFGTTGRVAAAGIIEELQRRLAGGAEREVPAMTTEAALKLWLNRTWVTRRNVAVDRIASAWLIRRFIDPQARFKFVDGRGYKPEPEELRFDMFEAEFTHEGDRCTFETLLRRASLDDPALVAIGEVVHDIDLKDDRYERPETAGVATLMSALANGPLDDAGRLARGADLLDGLYDAFAAAAKKEKKK
ncbi:chromate resistance protein ChrB domain-containing protein [Vineibacter terrae]|uniref:chromate resistance protein ChrB domain-containing protein n=1 Tax=Vineibacter terrae TaxID=2586908 RepID=UPI002E338BBA|nr:chromate resistance protein ChrB domain-containing protein [Vineibacter terrae]HEX2887224.1 chromate resistance protein ChrB domain-containing protein [Vineibacter terrae]